MRSGDLQFSVYKGDWISDQPQGKGIFYHHSHKGLIISGSFTDHGQTDNRGPGDFKVRYPSGDVYEGVM